MADDVRMAEMTADDLPWVRAVHLEHYLGVEGFDATFRDAVDAALSAVFGPDSAVLSVGWVAWRGTARAGCALCTAESRETANLRLFYVREEARGTGVGAKILTHATDYMEASGFQRLRIRTFDRHVAACTLYERNGLSLLSSKPVCAFGRKMRLQVWEKALSGLAIAFPQR